MNTIYCKSLLLMLLCFLTSCAHNPKQSRDGTINIRNSEKITDDEIRGLTIGHPFTEIQRTLHLEGDEYHIVENGTDDSPVYRYHLGDRFLFFRTDASGKITDAFFAS